MKKLFLIGLLLPSILILSSPVRSEAQIISVAQGGSSGGSVPANLTADSICFDITNHNACLKYGPGQLSGGGGGLANTLRLASGTTRQEFSIAGLEGATPDTSYYLQFIAPNDAGSYAGIIARRGDTLGIVNLQIGSDEGGLVILGNEDTGVVAISAQLEAWGSKGTNMRSDAQIGFSQTTLGVQSDVPSVGFQYESTGVVKVTNGTAGDAGYGIIDGKFSAEGTAGATHGACSITVTGITVKDGLITAITCT